MSVFTSDAIADATAIRQQLHSNPELKYEEHATSDLVAEFLKQRGYEVKTGLAETGVLAILDTGRPVPQSAFVPIWMHCLSRKKPV